MTTTARGARYWLVVAAGLAALLGANYYLRASLEMSSDYMYNFYRYFYPDAERELFGPGSTWWRRLLPFEYMTGSWSPFVLVLTHYVSDWVGPARTWLLYNALVMLASFGLSWYAFRSRVFSFTLAIGLGFGTQLYYAYPNSGTVGFALLFIYFQCVLLTAWKVVTVEEHRGRWKAAFGAALFVTALSYETWLDFLVFVWLAGAVLGVLLWQRQQRDWLRRLLGVEAAMTLAGFAYVAIKVTWGYGQQRGMESDLVFNYPHVVPAVEDVLSNLFLNLYMALTNFLPPAFVTSMAFFQLGGDRLVELQHGYHEPFSYLVPMQAMFLWRFYAGALAVVFVYALVRVARAVWRAPSAYRVAALVFMLMIATGGPTHAVIKARPLNSMAVQTYHVLTAVLGVSLLVALVLMLAWRRWPDRRGRLVVAGAWAVMFYSALARPAMVSHQAAQSGLGVQVYPNPMATLFIQLGLPYSQPQGVHLYQLERHDPARPPAASAEAVGQPRALPGAGMPVLPTAAPPLGEWLAYDGVTVEADDAAWRVTGNETPFGYQVVSPAIPVPPGATLLVRVVGRQEAGQACFGVLSGDHTRWLLPPDPARTVHAVDTGDTTDVSFAFTNCMTEPVAEASRFSVDGVTYGLLVAAEAPRP